MSDERDPETDQQLPEQNSYPVIQQLIITEAMESSLAIGVKKYGTGLQPFNGRDPLLDLEQELRDALVYARQLRYERDNPPVTDGLRELRDALVELLNATLPATTDMDRAWSLDRAEELLESGQLAKAVSTIRREAFERGASPAVGALLAEIQDYGEKTQYRQGLERAVELLIESWADSFKAAYGLGVKEGRKQKQAEQKA